MFDHLLRPGVAQLEAYTTGKPAEDVRSEYGLEEVVKLASNENPWGPSPKALEAIRREISNVHVYPDSSCRELRQALACRLGIQEDMVIFANGGSNLLLMIALAFIGAGDELVMAHPTFPVLRKATRLMGGRVREVPLRDHRCDLAAMAAAVGPQTKAICVCNPNNPTGTTVDPRELSAFLNDLPDRVLVVLDEVYIDFTDPAARFDVIPHLDSSKPILSVRSFSKIGGLAGLRIGYGLGPAALVAGLNRVREALPVNRLAQVAALAALDDEEHTERVVESNTQGRQFLFESLSQMGLSCVPSQANFVYLEFEGDAESFYQALLQRGYIVRPMGPWGQPQALRITVGTPEQNQRLVAALRDILSDEDRP